MSSRRENWRKRWVEILCRWTGASERWRRRSGAAVSSEVKATFFFISDTRSCLNVCFHRFDEVWWWTKDSKNKKTEKKTNLVKSQPCRRALPRVEIFCRLKLVKFTKNSMWFCINCAFGAISPSWRSEISWKRDATTPQKNLGGPVCESDPAELPNYDEDDQVG